MDTKKIISIEEAAMISKKYKNNKKIILCHGAFDLMHIGHIRHLQRAKLAGDILFVSITADKFIIKGPGRPVFNHFLRAENIAALSCVNYVFIAHTDNAIKSISSIKPFFYAKGSDYKNLDQDLTNNIRKEINEVRKYGGDIFYTDEITFSSSNLLNKHFNQFSSQLREFLTSFKSIYSFDSVIEEINKLENLSVLVIGDAIIDEYNYVNPMGQTGKGGVLSVSHKHSEAFAGGSLAVANHVSNFVKKVDLVTAISNKEDDELFIKSSISKNIKPTLHKILNYTVKKTRFLDEELLRFFEIYYYDGHIDLEEEYSSMLLKSLKSKIAKYDLVIATDFGNGFFNQTIRNFLSDNAKFLAVNTQINSANRGYHSINKYKSADFISLNEPEARLAIHDNASPIELVAEIIQKSICKSKFFTITRGVKGIFSISNKPKKFIYQPAFTHEIVDRVGAGDAYLALSSLILAKNNDLNLASFVGSVAAALDVGIIGNKESVDKVKLTKFINTLFK